MQDVEEAKALFKKASDLDANFIEAKAEFGLCYRYSGEFEEAEDQLKIALSFSQNKYIGFRLLLLF